MPRRGAVFVHPVKNDLRVSVSTFKQIQRHDAPDKVEDERRWVHRTHILDEAWYIVVILIVNWQLEENHTFLKRPVQSIQFCQKFRADCSSRAVCQFLVAASGN